MQHTRFKDRSVWEFEDLSPKLFIDYGRRQFDLAADMMRARRYESGIPDTACGNRFKATNGWNRAEIKSATKKNLDESGLVAVTCFHGTGLRFLNIYGGGERHSHATRILEAILEDAPQIRRLNLCYDIACVFEQAIHRYKPELRDRLQARIGRFHLYGHEHSCHILYNLLRTGGYGLMVGEEPEHLWFVLSHLIRSGRVSSGPRRTQKIDTCGMHIWLQSGYLPSAYKTPGIYNAGRALETMGHNLDRRWRKMTKVLAEATEARSRVTSMTRPDSSNASRRVFVTEEYLEQQAQDQIEYYTSYRWVSDLGPDFNRCTVTAANLDATLESLVKVMTTLYSSFYKQRNACQLKSPSGGPIGQADMGHHCVNSLSPRHAKIR